MSAVDVTQALSKTQGRMKRKLLSISRLLEQGVKRVIIADGRADNPISRALTGKGTVIS